MRLLCFYNHFFTIFSVLSHSSSICTCRVYFSERDLGRQLAFNVPVRLPASSSSNKPTAVAAPLRGVRIKGLKSISVSGSNHICMVMILVDTIPGSAAFTTIPLCLTRLAKSMVNRVNASFVLLYIGMRQKPPFFPRRKNPESQDDRWHTYKIPYSQYGSPLPSMAAACGSAGKALHN